MLLAAFALALCAQAASAAVPANCAGIMHPNSSAVPEEAMGAWIGPFYGPIPIPNSDNTTASIQMTVQEKAIQITTLIPFQGQMIPARVSYCIANVTMLTPERFQIYTWTVNKPLSTYPDQVCFSFLTNVTTPLGTIGIRTGQVNTNSGCVPGDIPDAQTETINVVTYNRYSDGATSSFLTTAAAGLFVMALLALVSM